MKIKWQISIALVLTCIIMIALLSGITVIQLKENVERERNASIANLAVQTALSFSYISDDLEYYLFNTSRSEGIASVLALSEDRGSRMLQINRFLQSIADPTYYIQSAYVVDEEREEIYGYAGKTLGGLLKRSKISTVMVSSQLPRILSGFGMIRDVCMSAGLYTGCTHTRESAW